LIHASALTNKGLIRPTNEDSFLSLVELGLFSVADGMGGHAAGEIASAIAIETIKSELAPLFEQKDVDKAFLKGAMVAAVKKANQIIIQRGEDEPVHRGMGTTLTTLVLLPDQNVFLFSHIGDSRLYILRDAELHQLSQDHTYVAELTERGYLTREEAIYHPFKHALTKALGINPITEVDFGQGELMPLDSFLLCTDGLTNEVPDSFIEKIMVTHCSETELCTKKLVEHALTLGGRDNITLVVASFRP